ncbi:hypothetical protein BLOT_015126 [Blomia tropicalis]|nr:hypothetical protein BLOT_015126 [Blomia tropicalis]
MDHRSNMIWPYSIDKAMVHSREAGPQQTNVRKRQHVDYCSMEQVVRRRQHRTTKTKQFTDGCIRHWVDLTLFTIVMQLMLLTIADWYKEYLEKVSKIQLS